MDGGVRVSLSELIQCRGGSELNKDALIVVSNRSDRLPYLFFEHLYVGFLLNERHGGERGGGGGE